MPQRIQTHELLGLKPQHALFVIEYVKDFSPRRAAEAAGYRPDYGHILADREDIQAITKSVLLKRLEAGAIDAEWLLMEAVDNHFIARQQGSISASNASLNIIAKHVFVDAFAAEKVEVNSSKEVMERLMRGRKRLQQGDTDADDVSFI